ncbi:MAG: NUDIX hydrolase [Archangiaceae bacterium]|nr:NUDIX hydrolase [Archangiaceae bacterium]
MTVNAIEVIEDFTSTGRCDEGFLQVRRLRVRNRRTDGSTSPVYRVDVVDRPRLDAVAVLVVRGAEVLTRMNLRPAAYFRKDKEQPLPDGRSHLYCEEIVAGLLETTDHGEAGLKHRAAEEVREEAGIVVAPADIVLLGPPFFVAPGIVSEKIFLCAVEVTGKEVVTPEGDGSPLEESPPPRWRTFESLAAAIASGEVQDAKTELALHRWLARQR